MWAVWPVWGGIKLGDSVDCYTHTGSESGFGFVERLGYIIPKNEPIYL